MTFYFIIFIDKIFIVFNKCFNFSAGKVIISILPPIYTENLKSTDVTDLCNKVRNQMEEVYYKTSLEISPSMNTNGHYTHSERRSPLSSSVSSIEGSGGLTILERIEEESPEASVETLSPDISPTERQKILADKIVEQTVADAQETIRDMINKNKTNSAEELAQEIVDKTVREAQEFIIESSHAECLSGKDDSG